MAMRWPRQVNEGRRCRATTRRSHCGRTIPKLGTIAAPHTSPSSATRRRWAHDALLRMTRGPALFANRGIALTQLKRQWRSADPEDEGEMTLEPRRTPICSITVELPCTVCVASRGGDGARCVLVRVLPDAVDSLLDAQHGVAELGRLNEA